eukprot:m.126874 g.126874  ORF g.126874 m.126874 type:complete len:608 (-) comp14530_c0_seq10:48-1871(-)
MIAYFAFLVMVAISALPQTVRCNHLACNWSTTPLSGMVLHGYPDNYNPQHLPHPNSLDGAEAYCCTQAASSCAGVVYQDGIYTVRVQGPPEPCVQDCHGVACWVNGNQPPSPGPPAPLPPAITVWPIPSNVTKMTPANVKPVPIAAGFTISTSSASQRLNRGVKRYMGYINASRVSRGVYEREGGMMTLQIYLSTESEELNLNTSYRYELNTSESTSSLYADTIYGALHGLETFTQMIQKGMFLYPGISIADGPSFRFRSLMIDTGRRFVPVSVVKDSLDAMSFTKMNVLHMHLSDDQRCAVQSSTYENLTSHLVGKMGGFYTHEDIQDLISFAADRGIIIIPEVDLPGHANGLQPLKEYGATFCQDSQMYDDVQGKTANVLGNLLTEYSKLFDTGIFHIGCDETTTTAECTLEATKSIEEKAAEALIVNKQIPMGWEEFLWRTNASQVGYPNTIIEAWSKYRAKDVVANGYMAVEAYGSHFYLNHLHPTSMQWVDIGEGINTSAAHLMLGGDICMWTPQYEPGGPGGNYFTPDTDATFAKSFGGLVWPRAAVGGAAFYNFVNVGFDALQERYETFAQVLIDRGIVSCPANCSCDYTTHCGKPISEP